MSDQPTVPAEPVKKSRFTLPSAYTILFALIVLAAIATWIIPAGTYNLNDAGEPIPGTYHEVASHPARILSTGLGADQRALRDREVRDGLPRGDRGGLRVAASLVFDEAENRLAHDQGRDGRDARELTCESSSHSGGNALLRRGEPLTAENQRANARVGLQGARPGGARARARDLARERAAGRAPRLQGSAYTEVEPYPLDLLGAQTEGMIGYLIQQELGNELPFESVSHRC